MTATRVATSALSDSLRSDLIRQHARLGELSRQVSSGRRLERFSDGPAAVIVAAQLRDDESRLAVYRDTASDAVGELNLAGSILQQASELLARIGDLTTAVGNPVDPTPRSVVAGQIDNLRDSLVTLANTTHNGRALFGGFHGRALEVTGGVVSFVGDRERVERRVGRDETIDVGIDGAEAFGFASGGASGLGGGDNVFSVINRLARSIAAGDDTNRPADLAALNTRTADLRNALAAAGIRGDQARRAAERNDDLTLSARAERSDLEDVDVAKVIGELRQAEVGYQATLGVMSRLHMRSLVDFLA